MGDYTISGGRSSYYPPAHYGAHFATATRATFCEASDFASLSANVLAIPGLQISVLNAAPVVMPASFFGMHILQRANDSEIDVAFKTVRSHDMANGKGLWKNIQPTSSADTSMWDFTDLDAWVDTHWEAGRELVFVLFGTPQWASARPTEENAYSSYVGGVHYNQGLGAEPSDMTKWDYYCTQIATRYLGKIKYYEVWNEPNYHNDGTGPGGYSDCFFTGTWAKLSEMVRRANQAIKAVDPTAKIISPAVQGWTATSGLSDAYFTGMMSASDGASGTMKNWVDIIAYHAYLPSPNRTQDISAVIDRVKACMTAAGVSGKELWDTESAPWQASTLNDAQFNQILWRMWATMAAKGVARTIYYQWDNAALGISKRPGIISATVATRALLMSGNMLNASRFSDGRFAYWTSGGVVIV